MAGRDSRPEEVGERLEAEALRPSVQEPPREPDRVDDRSSHPPTREALHGPVEKAHVESRVVGDEYRVAGEGEEASHRKVRHPEPAAHRLGRSP